MADLPDNFKAVKKEKGFWVFERDGTAIKFAKSKEEAEKFVEDMLKPIYGARSKNKEFQAKEYKIEEHDENNKKHQILIKDKEDLAY